MPSTSWEPSRICRRKVSGEEADERSDIFSLGVMVLEVLTGGRPFEGRTSAELVAAILSSPYYLRCDSSDDSSSNSKEVQRQDEVMQRCLAKYRTGRFASGAAMKQELIPSIEHHRSRAQNLYCFTNSS